MSVTHEPVPYSRPGESLVRDMYRAHLEGDTEAAGRVAAYDRWARMAQDRTTGAGVVPPSGYRPDLFVEAIQLDRPLAELGGLARITDATPFLIPRQTLRYTPETPAGRLVLPHTEGQAEDPMGLIPFDKVTVNPLGYSGTYDVTRELVDASGPSIDTIVRDALVDSYQEQTEAATYTVVNAGAPSGGPIYGDGPLSDNVVRELIAFKTGRRATASVAFASDAVWGALASITDATGRPMFPFLGPSNAGGTTSAGFAEMNVQGVPQVQSWALPANNNPGYVIARRGAYLTWESPRLTFTFQEVLGPGIVRLALWAYFAAAVLLPQGLRKSLYLAADPAADEAGAASSRKAEYAPARPRRPTTCAPSWGSWWVPATAPALDAATAAPSPTWCGCAPT